MASTCTSETTWTTTFPSSRWTEPPLPTPASCLSCLAIPHLCAASSLDRSTMSRLWSPSCAVWLVDQNLLPRPIPSTTSYFDHHPLGLLAVPIPVISRAFLLWSAE